MKKVILSFLFLVALASVSLYSCESKSEKTVVDTTTSNEDLVQRGGYLVSVMGCNDCHSPKNMGPNGPEIDPNLRLSGYPQTRPLGKIDSNVVRQGWYMFNYDMTATVGPWGVSYAANITSDETGIGNWTEEQFVKAFTQGKWKGVDNGRMLLPPMPWQEFAKLTSEDVKAIFLYLKSTKPVKNIEPPVQPLSAL